MNNWYVLSKADNVQGIVADETTGATIAVTYDAKNAPLIAAAPELLEALEECEKALTQYIDASTAMNPAIKQSGYMHPVVKLRDHARAAIVKATGAQ